MLKTDKLAKEWSWFDDVMQKVSIYFINLENARQACRTLLMLLALMAKITATDIHVSHTQILTVQKRVPVCLL